MIPGKHILHSTRTDLPDAIAFFRVLQQILDLGRKIVRVIRCRIQRSVLSRVAHFDQVECDDRPAKAHVF